MGLAVRLLFAMVVVPQLERRSNVTPDPDRYSELAASLVDRGELGFNPPGASPTTVRGPAFPAWLALGMLAGGRSPGWISFWSSIPGLVAAAVIFFVLDRSHGRRAALVGGLLCAVHPLSCFVSARVLPDEFYGALLLLGLVTIGDTPLFLTKLPGYRVARKQGSVPYARVAVAGVLLSLAGLTRATAVLVIGAVVVSALAVRPRRVRVAMTIGLIGLVMLGAWTLRTSALVGKPAFVESLGGYNFWLGEAVDRYGFAADFGQARERAHELMAAEAGTPETRSPSFYYGALGPHEARELDERLSDAAVKLVETAPLHYLRRCVAGLVWFWVRAETVTRTFQYALVALPLFAMGLFGLFRSGSRVLIFTVLAHVAIYAAICPMARYSVQLYPLLCYLAGTVFVTREPEFF